jgi:hypothetical protein
MMTTMTTLWEPTRRSDARVVMSTWSMVFVVSTRWIPLASMTRTESRDGTLGRAGYITSVG